MNFIKRQIVKSFKKVNIFKVPFYTIIVMPLFMFACTYIFKDDTDRYVYQWAIIAFVSLLFQVLINKLMKVEAKWIQYLYILIVINISMIVAYILQDQFKTIENIDPEWAGNLLASMSVAALLFGIKLFVWVFLNLKWKHIKIIKDQRIQLIDDNKELLEEVEHLRSLIKMKDEEEQQEKERNFEDQKDVKNEEDSKVHEDQHEFKIFEKSKDENDLDGEDPNEESEDREEHNDHDELEYSEGLSELLQHEELENHKDDEEQEEEPSKEEKKKKLPRWLRKK